MTNYLIKVGGSKTPLLEIQDIEKVEINEELDTVLMYGKNKKLKFYSNKVDTLFIADITALSEDSLKKLTNLPTEEITNKEELDDELIGRDSLHLDSFID